MVGAIGVDTIEVAIERSVFGGKIDGFLACHQAFGPATVFDDLSNCAGLEAVQVLVGAKVADAGHGTIFIHDFAEYPGFRKIGHPGKINCGFRVPRAAQDPIIRRLKGKDMAWLDEAVSIGKFIGKEADGK